MKQFKTAQEVVTFIKEQGVQMVDLRFMDFPGLWQHTTVPSKFIEVETFDKGVGFDGSSIRGWQAINESDMLIKPVAESAFVDPFTAAKTLVMICNICDPMTGEDYTRDPRNIARKAEAYLKSIGLADTAFFGPELEFFVFDDVRFDQNSHEGYYHLDSTEGAWNTGRVENPNLGYKIRHKEGYFPVPPMDTLMDMRSEMALKLQEIGIDVEVHHHEVASGGQCEIGMRFSPLLEMADNVLKYKYILKNVARKHDRVVTFMPKPLFGDNGTGMHVHFSLWKKNANLFAGDGYAGLSEMGMHAIGGILKHAPALLAITSPTTNSYKRLVPGYEAPVNLAYSRRNRSAACRIPMYSASPKAKRVEFRPPDPSANPYLAFAALLMAGLDGVLNKIEPGEPLDKDIYDLTPEEMKSVASMPGSLEEALGCLEDDHQFLLKGDVFTEELIETFIDYKRRHEADAVRLRPHPYEFSLYYDI
jgi:glutamine synthetase